MARSKVYASAAEKQAAYRARLDATTAMVDRAALDRLHQRLEQLQAAIGSAARSGDPFARRCRTVSVETMLDKLIAAFQEEACRHATGKEENP
jgi:hypothetical protein